MSVADFFTTAHLFFKLEWDQKVPLSNVDFGSRAAFRGGAIFGDKVWREAGD